MVRAGIEPPVDAVWPLLNDPDRFLRTAARLVLQRIDPKKWVERLAKEPNDKDASDLVAYEGGQSLVALGNMQMLRRDLDHAIDAYREIDQRLPDSSLAAYAHWKVAWLTLRQGRNADAKAAFDQQIALYPNSAEVPPALYWRARLAEEDNDPAMARAYYQKLFDRFRNYYYGELARQRLQQLKSTDDDPPHYALLDRVPPISGANVEEDETPSDNLRVQKSQLLANGALLEFAVRELQAAGNEEKGTWVPAETARIYEDSGRYDAAVEVMKHAVPNYFAMDLPSLPRSYWEALFPKPYWPDLRKFSSQNALDPYLVASLIRQESEFNPNAVSRKDAVGLMQLLPKVGKGVAKQQKIKRFSAQQLFTPAVNLQLGTRYFRHFHRERQGVIGARNQRIVRNVHPMEMKTLLRQVQPNGLSIAKEVHFVTAARQFRAKSSCKNSAAANQRKTCNPNLQRP